MRVSLNLGDHVYIAVPWFKWIQIDPNWFFQAPWLHESTRPPCLQSKRYPGLLLNRATLRSYSEDAKNEEISAGFYLLPSERAPRDWQTSFLIQPIVNVDPASHSWSYAMTPWRHQPYQRVPHAWRNADPKASRASGIVSISPAGEWARHSLTWHSSSQYVPLWKYIDS
jgi:hypothetical protein